MFYNHMLIIVKLSKYNYRWCSSTYSYIHVEFDGSVQNNSFKDDIMHNHWGSISLDVISQRFTKSEHFTFLMILRKDVIEAAWYFHIPFSFQTQILTHNTSKISLKLKEETFWEKLLTRRCIFISRTMLYSTNSIFLSSFNKLHTY